MSPHVRTGVIALFSGLLIACGQREDHSAAATEPQVEPVSVSERRDIPSAAVVPVAFSAGSAKRSLEVDQPVRESMAELKAQDSAVDSVALSSSGMEKRLSLEGGEPQIKEAPRAIPADPAAIFDAVKANDKARLLELLETGLPAEQVDAEGDTPLCLALRLRFIPLALELLQHGAKADTPGFDQQAPVVLASMYRHPVLLEELLKAGADANKAFRHPVAAEVLEVVPDPWLKRELKRERNVTPLMACSIRGDVEGVITLIKYGARKNAHTLPSYRYAINMAADHKYLFIMRVLLGRDPDEEPARLITVDLSEQRFWVVEHGQQIMASKISSGRAGKETPDGRYVITNKHKDWKSTIYKVDMPFFLRLNCSEIGLHSGRVTGRPASAGCVRLPYDVAKKMFSIAQVGDEVIIQP